MSTTLTWRTSFSTSVLHAAEALLRGENLADPRMAGALAEPAALMQREIDGANLPKERFWWHLLGLSATLENNRDLASRALVKTIGRGNAAEMAEPRLTVAIAAVETAASRELPKMAEELALRTGPLREQWEARGPGFLRQVGLLTEESLLVEQGEVVVVHPALGGGGTAYLPGNQVRIEGVLANPYPHLPEVVRLGWLLAQLNMDLPSLSEGIHPDRLPLVAPVALLPVALAAGKELELCQDLPELLGQAIAAWRIRLPNEPEAVGVIIEWWETYRETHPPFAVALAALDQMLV